MQKGREFLNDEDWLKLRRGRSTGVDGDAVLMDVIAKAELDDAAGENVEHDWHRLRFALSKEKTRSNNKGYFAQAAAVLLLVGSVYWLLPDGNLPSKPQDIDEAMMRGKSVVELYSAEIPADANKLAQKFESLGVVVVRKIGQDKAELEIRLSYPLNPAVVELIRDEDIPVPDAGDLHLLFLPRASLN